jgi:hypothetical protein
MSRWRFLQLWAWAYSSGVVCWLLWAYKLKSRRLPPLPEQLGLEYRSGYRLQRRHQPPALLLEVLLLRALPLEELPLAGLLPLEVLPQAAPPQGVLPLEALPRVGLPLQAPR